MSPLPPSLRSKDPRECPLKFPQGTVSICGSFRVVKYTRPPYLHNKHVYGATFSRNGRRATDIHGSVYVEEL